MTNKEPPKTHFTPPSPASKTRTYPWGLCIGRFFKRLLAGALVLVVVFLFLIMSALPYGGDSPGIASLARLLLVLVPLWALAGLLPPAGTWDTTISASKMAAYVFLVVLAVGLAGTGSSMLATKGEKEARARAEDRELGIRLCSADLDGITAPLTLQSLLIDSGVAEKPVLGELLGRRGLKFVELRPRTWQDWRSKEERHGVTALDGDQSTHFDVSPEVSIVRLSLSRAGDPSCPAKAILGLGSSIGNAPFAPDTCLRVDLDRQSRATHLLKALPADSHPPFIKWTVLEQSNGKVLASLSSSDSPSSPSHQGGGAQYERKTIGGDTVSCRSPHFSLMTLMYGPADDDQRLRLGTRFVALDLDLADPASLGASMSLTVPEKLVLDWNERGSARSGPEWETAYRTAGQLGWASYEQGVIDFKAGAIVTPRLRTEHPRRPLVRGSDRGFMAAWSLEENRTALAHFGLDGRLLWVRQLDTAIPVNAYDKHFSLEGMEWNRHELRLYGFRRLGNGRHAEVRVRTVPLTAHGLPRTST